MGDCPRSVPEQAVDFDSSLTSIKVGGEDAFRRATSYSHHLQLPIVCQSVPRLSCPQIQSGWHYGHYNPHSPAIPGKCGRKCPPGQQKLIPPAGWKRRGQAKRPLRPRGKGLGQEDFFLLEFGYEGGRRTDFLSSLFKTGTSRTSGVCSGPIDAPRPRGLMKASHAFTLCV